MNDHPAVYLPAKIVDQDEDGYIYEAGARRHKRPFVSVEPVYTFTANIPETMIDTHVRVEGLEDGRRYAVIPLEANDE